MVQNLAIGIDLGTTYCSVAVLKHTNKSPEVLPNDFGKKVTPSYVAYYEDGEVCMGELARNHDQVDPENTIYDIKRLIGRSFHDPSIQKYLEFWPFKLVNYKGLLGVQIGDKTLLPQEILKEIIAYLLKSAEGNLGPGCHVKEAVVTIPANFETLQQELTREACTSAGLESIQFISEPAAAALAYYANQPSHGQAKTCLTFDLGGGSFDVAVILVTPDNLVEVIASGGDDRLGGQNFDQVLSDYCVQEFKKRHNINLAEGEDSPGKLRDLKKQCEMKKCFLSQIQKVAISLDTTHDGINFMIFVTREIFENLISPHLAKCMEILDSILNDSGVSKEEIDDVMLIGGSTRIPKVQEIVGEYFGWKTLQRRIDADEAVACGAAIHAFETFGANEDLFLDEPAVTPRNLNLGKASTDATRSHLSQMIMSMKELTLEAEASLSNLTAVAFYEYEAVQNDEISIGPGDEITNITLVEEGWAMGQCEDKFGHFPTNFVVFKIFNADGSLLSEDPEDFGSWAPTLGTTSSFSTTDNIVVLSSVEFRAKSPEELSFEIGELIMNVEKLNKYWWRGRLNGKIGFFPANYVKTSYELEEVAGIRLKGSDGLKKSDSSSGSGSGSGAGLVALADYTHTASDTNQMSFHEGDLIFDIEKFGGWWRGTCKDKVGLFPANHVLEFGFNSQL